MKGIRPDARETAREAARRAGMSVGEWLNTVILDSADEEGVRLSHRGYDDEDDSDQLFGVHERLDELTRQLDRLQRTPASRPSYAPTARGPEAYAPPSYWQNRDSQLAEAIARLDRRMDDLVNASRAMPVAPTYIPNAYAAAPVMPEPPQAPPADAWNSDMDQAMAEINARMLALDADPEAAFVPPQRPAAAPKQSPQPRSAPVPSQNLAGLEQHLRHITSQIEMLRQQPQLQEGLAALREALSDIARTLLDAMPKRAIEALEGEVRALAARLDNNRQAGVDGNALAAMEGALAEIRDTLQTLRPAENLNGFREAVHSLAQKIDMLGAAGPDASSVQQIETAVAAMQGIVSQVASNEALAQLTAEVRTLSEKIDRAVAAEGSGEATQRNALEILDQRIARIAEALESRVQQGGSVPPQLEAVIQGLTDKIERLQQSGGDGVAVGNLEDRVARLVEKLDASGARFSQLEAIERGLADLLVHIESKRGTDAPAPQVDGLQRDLARTQTSLEAVHGTLGHVVDRLAMLESDLRDTRSEPKASQSSPSMPAAAQLDMPVPRGEPPVFTTEPAPAETSPPPSREAAHAQAVAAMARANPRAVRKPINPDLPPDHPLEPGFNSRARLSVSPADRIAASEAALGSARPPETSGKSNFIAAARRAAKAAAGEPTTADLRAAATLREPAEKPGKTLAQRVRKFFIGASVIVLAAGALRIAADVIDFGDTPSAPEISSAEAPKQPESAAPAREIQPQPPTDTTAPALQMPATPDVTGSVKTPAQASQSYTLPLSMTLPSTQPSLSADKLPPGIGGPVLRQAAATGDAAAEYEIGLRYAEGRGVTANPAEAVRWLEAAAKQGLVMAQFRLAGFYEKGIGVKKDVETARRLYKTAAEQGNAKAMHNLAVLYAEGAAVKPDYKTAAQWFRSAAEHGLADSQYNLAILYARGIGVDQNLVESYKWFALAANQGDQEAGKKRDEVAKRLDAQALATAKLAVQVFAPKQQPEAATSVKLPPGGWDAASSAPDHAPAKPKRNAPVRVGSR